MKTLCRRPPSVVSWIRENRGDGAAYGENYWPTPNPSTLLARLWTDAQPSLGSTASGLVRHLYRRPGDPSTSANSSTLTQVLKDSRSPRIRSTSGQTPNEIIRCCVLMIVAARFEDPIVSPPPNQFARDRH